MELADHQRILLGLIRSSYEVRPDDPIYFHHVARSRDLLEARGNIYLWRVYVLERSCVLTMALLRQRGWLAATLDEFIRRTNISPFRETQGPAFLTELSRHEDSLLAAVAGFELALTAVRDGDLGTYLIPWPAEPCAILHSLATGGTIDASPAPGVYQIRVAHNLPGLFEINTVTPRCDTSSPVSPVDK